MASMDEEDCASCGGESELRCRKSKRPCGHHCNHSWTHDACCWCDEEFGEMPGQGPNSEGSESE